MSLKTQQVFVNTTNNFLFSKVFHIDILGKTTSQNFGSEKFSRGFEFEGGTTKFVSTVKDEHEVSFFAGEGGSPLSL